MYQLVRRKKMYYLLDIDYMLMNVCVEKDSNDFQIPRNGTPIADDIEVPFRFTMEIEEDDDGEFEEPKMEAYFPNVSLMQKKLVEILRNSGVDNIQTFPTVITHPETNKTYDDYLLVNVIGMLSCANVEASTTSPLADVYYFHNLVIDPQKVEDLLIFRLAESQMNIIIHEKVAKEIEKEDFKRLILEPLSEEATA